MERFLNKKIVFYSLLFLIFLLILYLLILIRPIYHGVFIFVKEVGIPFLISLIISYLLHPVVNWLVKIGLKRTFAVVLIYLFFFLGTGLVIYIGTPALIEQFRDFSEHLPEIMQTFDRWLEHFEHHQSAWPDGIREGIEHGFAQIDHLISRWTIETVKNIGQFMRLTTVVMLVPFIVFYMLKDYEGFHERMMHFFPKKQRRKIDLLLREINDSLGNYVSGQLIVSLFVGILVYIGYLIIRFPYPLVFSFISMIFNIVPYIGPLLGTIPAMIIAITVSWKLALYVALVNIIVQTIEGNFLSPIIVGRSTHLHPLAIIIAILIGGELAGITGLILAVPFLVMLKVIMIHLVNHYAKAN